MTPPILNKEYDHSNCKYDLSICQAFAALEKDMQGLAMFSSLTGKEKLTARKLV